MPHALGNWNASPHTCVFSNIGLEKKVCHASCFWQLECYTSCLHVLKHWLKFSHLFLQALYNSQGFFRINI